MSSDCAQMAVDHAVQNERRFMVLEQIIRELQDRVKALEKDQGKLLKR